MEATVVSLARSVLDGVASSASAAAADEVASLLGVSKEVEFIRHELEMMRSELMDAASEAAVRSNKAKTSVKQLRDLAYDFEDCLLDFALYADRYPSSLARLAPAAVAERHRIAKQILDLKASLEVHTQRGQRYRIFTDIPAARATAADDHDASMHQSADHEVAFKESDIIGRRSDKVKLTRLISRAHQSEASATVSVVAVCGMGGMGKSSLVRMVHNDPDLIAKFDCSAWVTVPRPLGGDAFRKRLMKELASSAGMAPEAGLNATFSKIGEFLQDKRYLVVVDDLHDKEEWDTIWRLFQFHNHKDSRIIVTTRRKDVAQHCAAAGNAPNGHDQLIFELKPLEEHESKRLLCQKVYKKSDYPLPPDMEEQASYILRKCWGLPLAICTIGGFLSSRPTTSSTEWRNLHEHLGVELESDLKDITNVILSSYNGLPYHLKSIFLYLSIFPENHEIRRTRLLRRWMAEGYIPKKRDMLVEEVAARFYNELISRSMIQGSKASRGVGVDRCQVHSMVREIILSSFIDEIKLFPIEEHSNDIPRSKIRHLVVSVRLLGLFRYNLIP